jgi:hypothetical protein
MKDAKPYEEMLRVLLERETFPLRPAKVFDPSLAVRIDSLDENDEVKAGLHHLNDDLDRAHALAQAHEGDKTCDYWHAIVHRREGDFDNAKYWLRKMGRHPVLTRVHDGGPEAAIQFVDRCRDVRPADLPMLEATQRRELLGLLDYAWGSVTCSGPGRD